MDRKKNRVIRLANDTIAVPLFLLFSHYVNYNSTMSYFAGYNSYRCNGAHSTHVKFIQKACTALSEIVKVKR